MNKLKILAASLAILSLVGCGGRQITGRESYKNHGEKIEDSKVISEVRRVLLMNPLIPNDLIHLAIDRGVVQLSGFVRSPEEASVALLSVKSTPGVKDIINSLVIPEGVKASHKNRKENHDDLRLIARVKHNFNINSSVPSNLIHLSAHRGVVQLSGFVHNAEEANNAVLNAKNTLGVVEVINSLIVLSSEEYAIKRGVAEANSTKR